MIQLISIAKKGVFFLKIENKSNFDFFPFAVSRRLLSESSGNGPNCNIFEYLMMYQFDSTDIIITILYQYISKICLSGVLMMAHINNLEKRIPQKYREPKM